MIRLNYKLLEEGCEPTKGHPDDAGIDLKAREAVTVYPNSTAKVGTGVAFSIPRGYYGKLSHRSNVAFKGDTIASLGIVDAGYLGEVKVKLFNLGVDPLHIQKGQRFAQMVVLEKPEVSLVPVDDLGNSERGKGGFGSTGS